jgi:proline dehydrogenase
MDIGTRLFRSTLLALAGNRVVENLALKFGMRLGANKFVAAEILEDAIKQIRILNHKGISSTLDYLGESIRHLSEAAAFKEEYLRLLDKIREEQIESNISLKPTQMGLALDAEVCYTNIRDIVIRAQHLNNFVRLDMENTPYTDATINITLRLHLEGLTNVGTVIQACLYRTEEDLEKLTYEKFNLRIVKGAYKEPKELAYPLLNQVDANFKRLIQARLDSGVYTAIATHDEAIIEWAKKYIASQGISLKSFEFQMLYGVRMQLQEDLATQGYKVRCYVPYGKMWYPYFVRRLAERPANVIFILKNMFRR